MLIGLEAWWAPQPVWMIFRVEKIWRRLKAGRDVSLFCRLIIKIISKKIWKTGGRAVCTFCNSEQPDPTNACYIPWTCPILPAMICTSTTCWPQCQALAPYWSRDYRRKDISVHFIRPETESKQQWQAWQEYFRLHSCKDNSLHKDSLF
jgi:hypothetical protein